MTIIMRWKKYFYFCQIVKTQIIDSIYTNLTVLQEYLTFSIQKKKPNI